jgi:hypothetical protein
MEHDLIICIEDAFGDVPVPSLEERELERESVDQSFFDAVASRAWQELRPLRRFVEGGPDLGLLAPELYRYYLPAYLVALADPQSLELYLSVVLHTLWYKRGAEDLHLARQFFSPDRNLHDTMTELEAQLPELTDQERRNAAETLIGTAAKLARATELTGHDFFDAPSQEVRARELWEQRIPLLNHAQKRCIARVLQHVSTRTTNSLLRPRIQESLCDFWGAFLAEPEGIQRGSDVR